MLARKAANFEPIVQEINNNGGLAIGIGADTSDAASLKSAFEQLKEHMGDARLAAAVYNVGGGIVRKPFLELSEDDVNAAWASSG